MDNIMIVGTSHISSESIERINKAFVDFTPDIVCLELDRKRLFALIHNIKAKPKFSDIKRIGLMGFLFASVGGWLQEKLGESVGMKPGSEMKAAYDLALKSNAKIALIDQDIEITLRRLSKKFGWGERLRMALDLIISPFGKKETVDLTKVPEKQLIKRLLEETKKKYPGIYSVLVQERNVVMIANIIKIRSENPHAKILAVVGAGHEDEMIEFLKAQKLQ